MTQNISLEQRIEKAAHLGQDAFWRAAAVEFPEIESGDVAVDVEARFQAFAEIHIRRWVKENYPKKD